jgi:hypothetical protein
MPIGLALATGWDDQRRTTWRLIVDGVELSGRWGVVDRQFISVE